MKKYIVLLFLLISVSGYAQNTINNYKYVLVPEKFSFLKQVNQYRLNTLAKSLIEDKGLTAYFDNTEIPAEIAANRCSALNLDIIEKNGMFTTNLTLILKDCQGNIVFKSKEGKSREKEYGTSYNMALRDAFSSLDGVQYAYAGPAAGRPAVNVASSAPVSAAVVPSAPAVASTATAEVGQPSGTLYAQSTGTGYQLIDTTPKIVLTLFKTSVQDYFIANNATSNGLVLKKNGDWFFEYYKDGKLTADKLSIKF